MTPDELLNKLKDEKLCPSKLGLHDYGMPECANADEDNYLFYSCDYCRELATSDLRR